MSTQIAVTPRLPAFIPRSVPEARAALARMKRDVDTARTYAAIRQIERMAEATKVYYCEIEAVRQDAESVVLCANHRIATELRHRPLAKGTRGRGRPALGGPAKGPPNRETTLAEQVGSKNRGVRLRHLGAIPRPQMETIAAKLHAAGEAATVRAVIKAAADEETETRRKASRNAQPLPGGMDRRIGDCRKVLADIPDNSVPLILTDPPYGVEAEPLYQWLGKFAARVLIPGGSLVCYVGQTRLTRSSITFGNAGLREWWIFSMDHDQARRIPGKFVLNEWKPVLWHVKDFRRGRSMLSDKLRSSYANKHQHNWGQGEGGIGPVIEHLTEPGELIVDPFAGTATWGRIAAGMGRRWIGADIVEGGSETIAA